MRWMRWMTYVNTVRGNLPALEMGHLIGRPVLYGDVTAGCQLCIQCGGWSSHKERYAAPLTKLKQSVQQAIRLGA